MADKNPRRNPTTDALFDAILSLETREECYNFFEDLCTVKEISDMAQRLEAAKLLLSGSTYDQIVKAVEISTATISRINRCIQYAVKNGMHYLTYLEEITDLVHKVQTAYNENLKELKSKGMLPLFDAGYINLSRQYLTIGVNGLVEAAEFLGIHIEIGRASCRERV